MQQTDKYKLNLIEKTDTFSPDPLNDNAQKLEAAITAEAAARTSAGTAEAQARASADKALDARVKVLELHRVVVGRTAGGVTVDLGFTPQAVISYNGYGAVLAIEGYPSSFTEIIDGGFKALTTTFNAYSYVALA